jgi:DNA-binding beta-propeller fold protein YncE
VAQQKALIEAQERAIDERQRIDAWERSLKSLISKVNPTGSSINCGKVAEAVDQSLADGKRHAAPGGVNGTDDEVMARHPGSASGIRSYDNELSLESGLSKLPDGSRGFISVDWADGSRHLFNYVKLDGTVYYIDGQTGTVTTSITDIIFDKGTDWKDWLQVLPTYTSH